MINAVLRQLTVTVWAGRHMQ